MDQLYARYPFLEAAREAVYREAPAIEELVGTDTRSAALDRAIERIDCAISGETTGSPHRDTTVEVLSYPLARLIVSLLDDRRITARYVGAEGRTAAQRFRADMATVGAGEAALDTETIFEEFDLDVNAERGEYEINVLDFLRLVTQLEGQRWRLVNRPLRDGWVRIDREELPLLVDAAVRNRVGADLPMDVPEEIATQLEPVVDTMERNLGKQQLPTSFETVDPALFPPCMQALLERIEAGEHLPPHSRYAIATFLTSIGLAPADLGVVIDEEMPDAVIHMAEAVVGEEGPTQFPPGSCATMVALGDCVNRDSLCATIEHPLAYYEQRLAD